MSYHPICYFIGHWEGKDFHYVAEVNTRELAEKVAEITGREILSDDDADPVENFIRDYGTQEPDDTAANSTDNPTRPVCPSGDFGCPYYQEESGHYTLEDPAHNCDDYIYYNGADGENA